MRILLVSLGFPKYEGDSTAPFMVPIVAGLAARGHVVDVVLPYHPDFRYPESGHVRFCSYRYSPVDRFAPWGFGNSLSGDSRISRSAGLLLPAAVLSLRWKLVRLLSMHRYDVVHAHWLLPNAWVAAGPAARRGIPLVATLHGSDLAIAERTFLLRRAARVALVRAGAVTAVSDDLRLRAEALGADPRAITTVHLGIDSDTFSLREPNPALRVRLGAQEDDLLVVTIGRLVEKKGFRYLIEAISQLKRVHLAVVGEGDLKETLEAAARELEASVTFTGNVDHAAVADLLATADVFAVPSVVDSTGNVDGLPTALLEALAAGRAVVASFIAGIPEVVTDRVNGLLVPQKDAHALATAIAELRDDPELRKRLGAEARRRAAHELDWGVTMSRFEAAYESARRRSLAK